MHAPVISNIIQNKEVLIERSLPRSGKINVQVGAVLRPFDHIGECSVSMHKLVLPEDFRPEKFKVTASQQNKFYFQGNVLGKLGPEKILAPYNGYLNKMEDKYVFEESETRYTLLSGLWGTVEKVIPERSVLIRTKSTDIKFFVSTPGSFAGELIFFEKKSYQNNTADLSKKIIFYNGVLTTEVLEKAISCKVQGILGISMEIDALPYAKRSDLNIGSLYGFGQFSINPLVEKLFSSLSFRHVFYYGEDGFLRVPLPVDEGQPGKSEIVRLSDSQGVVASPEPANPNAAIESGEPPKKRKLRVTKTSTTAKSKAAKSPVSRSKKGKATKTATKAAKATSTVSSLTSLSAPSLVQSGVIREVTEHAMVLVLQEPYFGKLATVDRIDEYSIFVKFLPEKDGPKKDTNFEVFLPNFYLIA